MEKDENRLGNNPLDWTKKKGKKSSEKNTEDWIRCTFLVKKKAHQDIKEIALIQKTTIKEIMNEIMMEYIQKNEKDLKKYREFMTQM